MSYNPNIHHRCSIRLKGYDYSQEGLYFVTICCQHRECLFGKIVGGKMILNNAGKIVDDCWLAIPNHFPNVILHEYVIMPNHFHGIIEITVGAGSARPNDNTRPARPDVNIVNNINDNANLERMDLGRANPAPTVGNIVGYFKYHTTKRIDLPTKLWQRNYYEHIIRNERSFNHIAEYIVNNPNMWNKDKFYKK